MQKQKRGLVIGAGIAGPATAIELNKHGFEVEIFEARQEEEMGQGVFLGITPNGLNALKELIDIEQLMSDYTPGSMIFYNARNKEIGRLPTAHQREKYGSETVQIRRSDISFHLRQEVQEKQIPIHYGKQLEGVLRNDRCVQVRFSDGSETTGDFLIACDGVHSTTRMQLFTDAPAPVYTRLLSTGAFVQLEDMQHLFGPINMTFGRRAFFAWAVSNKGDVWWFNNFYMEREPTREELRTTLQQEVKEHLLEIHREDPDPIPKIIRETEELFVYPIYETPSLQQWHQNRVCLIGDAAHATAPHIGQGASLALEDAVVLARCLNSSSSPDEAFKRFQSLRKPRVEKLIRTARKVGNQKSKPNSVAVFFRDLLLRHFIRLEIRKMDWVYGYKP